MIIVSGTKRSGTSLWMHLLVQAGLPLIGERFPKGWAELLHEANPDGFFESELVSGIYHRTNPHPLTGAYLPPQQTRTHVVKVFIPGLIRTDVAFIDRCVATIRSWREYVVSIQRMQALSGQDAQTQLPPALEWWVNNYGLIRDLAIRGYPAHVVSFDSLLRDPQRVIAETLAWVGHGDASQTLDVVRPEQRGGQEGHPPDAALADGIEPRYLAVFDELHHTIDAEQPLTASFIDTLNRTDEALRPMVLERRAVLEAATVADILARG